MRNLDGGTERANKAKQIRARERDLYCGKPSHRNADDGAMTAIRHYRKPTLDVSDEIGERVVLIPVTGLHCRVHVIREGTFRHDKNQAPRCISGDIGVV